MMARQEDPERDAANSEEPILRLNQIGIAFRGVKALSDVTFDIPFGGLTAVIGPNGAGKTTLFNCISGIYRHQGDIELAGQSIQNASATQRARNGIARTFQTPTLVEQTSVLENVLLGASAWAKTALFGTAFATRRSRSEAALAKEIAREMVAAVGLQGAVTDRSVSELAHADRRRVEIARALVARPRLLLLDEPAAGLSAAEADELLSMVLEYGRNAGMTALLVEHDVSLVMRVARRVAVLDTGTLLTVGSPNEVRLNPAVIAAYLGAEDSEESGQHRMEASS